MQVAVIGLGAQKPAQHFRKVLEGRAVLARNGRIARSWPGFPGHSFTDLADIFDRKPAAEIPDSFTSVFREFQREGHASVSYLVPEAGNLGDESVSLLCAEFDVEFHPGAIDSGPGMSDVHVVDALAIALAECARPFDAGRIPLSPSRNTIITNYRGSEVIELASRRIRHAFGDLPHATSSDTLHFPATIAPQETPSFDGFERIVSILRSPEGCPWDREQTISSLLPQLAEELDEFQVSLREEEAVEQADELGDVLLHIVMIAQIARESGNFTMSDVIRAISAKMVRRHPHVFGDVVAENIDDLHRIWNDVKKQEKANKNRSLRNGGKKGGSHR